MKYTSRKITGLQFARTLFFSAALLFLCGVARAQVTYNYNPDDTTISGTDLWSTSVDWTPSTPASGNNTTLDYIFTGTNTGVLSNINDNNLGDFQLNSLILDGTGSSTAGANASILIQDGTLEFQDSSAPLAPVLTLSAINGTGGTVSYQVNSAVLLDDYLTINGSGNAAFAIGGVISSSGVFGITLNTSNTLVLTAANTYTGSTTITTGTLQLGDGTSGHDGSIASTAGVLDNSALVYNRFGAVAAGYNISGTGKLTMEGSGTQTLSGTNTYGGATNITSGVLQAGSTTGLSASSAFVIATPGVLDLNTFSSSIGSLAGSGTVTNSGGSLAILATGGNNTNTNFSGVIQNGAVGLALTKVGTGTFTLSGVNSFTGTTTLAGGALNLGSAGALGGGGSVTFAGGALQYSASNTSDLSGLIVGSGSAIKIDMNGQSGTYASSLANTNTGGLTMLSTAAGGKLFLSAANSYSGTTNVTSGTLVSANATALGSTANPVVLNGGGLDLEATSAYNTTVGGAATIYSDNLAGGVGTTRTLGTLSIGNFTLTAADGANVTSGTGTLAFGATTMTASGVTFAPTSAILTLASLTGAGDNVTFGGTQTGTNTVGAITTVAGTVTKNSAATWEFAGTSTYTGATSITSGTTIVAANNPFGTGGALTFNGAGLTVEGTGATNFTIGNLSTTFTSSGVIIGGTSPLTIGGTFVNNINGSGSVTVNNTGLTTIHGGIELSSGAGGRSLTIFGTGNVLVDSVISPNPGATGQQQLFYTSLGGTMTLSNANGGSVAGITGGNTTLVTVATGVANTATAGNATLLISGNYTIGSSGSAALVIKGGTTASGSPGQGTLSTEDGTINTLTINTTAAANTTVLTMAGGAGTPSILNMDVGNTSADEIVLGNGSNMKASIGAGGVLVNLNGIGNLAANTYKLISGSNGLATISLNSTTGNFSGYDSASLTTTTGTLTVTIGGLVATPATAYWKGDDGAGGSGTWNTFTGGTNNVTNWTSAISGGTNTQQTPGSATNVYFIADTGSNATTTYLGVSGTINTLNFTGTDATVTTGSAVSISGSATGSGTNATLTINSGLTSGLGAGVDTISAPIALGGNQTWTLNGSVLSVTGTLSGAHNLTVAGTGGELILGGANTFSGTLGIGNNAVVELNSAGALGGNNAVAFSAASSGTLVLNGFGATIGNLSSGGGGGTPVIQNNNVGTAATLTGSQTTSGTFAGVIQNGGGSLPLSFTKTGTAALTLTGVNTYTGSTIVNGGALYINGSLGAGSNVAVNSAGTLGGSAGTVSGAVTVNNGGTINPGTSTTPATLNLGNGLTISGSGIVAFNIVDGGANDFLNITGNVTFNSGAILEVTGGMSQADVYTLLTTSGAAPSLAGVTEEDLNGNPISTNDPHYALSVSGNSIILTVTAASTAIPGITITSPAASQRIMQNTLNVTVNGNVSDTGVVALNGTLSSSGGNFTVGNFSPTGGTFQTGTGASTAYSGTIASVGSTLGLNTFNMTVTDGNANPASATTTGTLDVLQNRVVTASAAAIGSIHRNSTAGSASTTLSTTGSDSQNTRVTVADGGADNTANGFSVSGGANPTFNDPASSDSRTVSGGTFTGLGAQSGTITLTTTGEAGVLGTQSPVNVNVVYTANVFSGQATWAVNSSSSWTTATNWGDTNAGDLNGAGAPGLDVTANAGDTATFNDVPLQSGTLTVSLSGTTASLNGIIFNSTHGYVVSGGTITLQGAATPVSVTAGDTGNINSVLSGGGLNVTGGGTLVLGAANTYTGSTQISKGIVQTTVSNALPITTVLALGDVGNDSGQLVLGNATTVASQTLAGLQTLGSGANNSIVAGGAAGFTTLTFNVPTATYTYSGSVGGVGANQNNLNIAKTGTGTELLSGSDTYTGTTNVSGGVLGVSGAAANSTIITLLGSANGGNGAILQSNGTLTRSTGASATNAGAGGLNWGSFSGFSAQGGTFTVNLTGLSGAQLQWSVNFASIGTTGIDFGSTTSDSQINFTSGFALMGTGAGTSRAIYVEKGVGGDSTLLSGVISDGTGGGINGYSDGITKNGAGLLILGGANTYTGVTTVSAGAVRVTNNNGLGSGATYSPNGGIGATSASGTVSVATGATLDLSNVTVNKVIGLANGSTLTNSSASASTLDNGIAQILLVSTGTSTSGASSGTTYTAPALTISAPNNPAGTTATATATVGGTNTGVNSVTVTAAGSGYTSAPTVTINDATGTGATATAVISALALTGSDNIGGAGSIQVNSVISGGGVILNLTGAAPVVLTAANTYTGTTMITSGTLQLGDATSGHDGTVATTSIVDNSALVYDRFGSATYSGTISGTGNVTVASGTQILTGSNSYTGTTTILDPVAATLQLGDGTSGHDGTIGGSPAIVDNGILIYDRFGKSSFGGVISGSGVVNVLGSGTQVLTGASTYTGTTTITNSTLQLGDGTTGHDGSIGSSPAIVDNGTLIYDRFGNSNSYGGAISGTGAVTMLGGGTQTLSGNSNTYSGNTTINQGNLSVTNSGGSATGSGTVNVTPNQSAPATLSGNGIISGLVITSAASGSNIAHIAPAVNTGGNLGIAGTLTLSGGLTLGQGTNLDYDISNSSVTAGGGLNDLINLNGGVLTLPSGGTLTFNFGILGGGSPVTGSAYTLIDGVSSFSNFNASNFITTGIGSDAATFSISGSNLDVTFLAVNSTTFTLVATPGQARVMQSNTTSLQSVITNTGTTNPPPSDNLAYTGLGNATAVNGSVAGSAAAGTLAPTTSATNTTTYTAGSTTGLDVITPTATGSNANLGGAAAGSITSGTIAVLANRVVSAGAVNYGDVLEGVAQSGSTTLTTSGSDNNFTRITLQTASATDGTATVATGTGAILFNSPASSGTRAVTASFVVSGSAGGSVSGLAVTGESLQGETDTAPTVAYSANVFQAFSGSTGSAINGGTTATLSLTNLAPTDGGVNGQRAGAAITGWSTTNSNFVVTTDNGGAVGTATQPSGDVTAPDVGTVGLANNLLSGTYSYSGTITASAHYTDTLLQSQGTPAIPSWNGVTLSGTVSASASYGQTNTAFISNGSSMAGYGLTSSQGDQTAAQLLAGTTSADTHLTMSFSAHGSLGANETSSPSPFQSSDTLTLGGLNPVGGNGPDGGSTITDPFVLQLSVTANPNVANGLYYLGWWDPNFGATGGWVNAIAGNSNANLPGDYGLTGAYNYGETYAQWAGNNPGLATLQQQLGAYGYDPNTGVAWAVLNFDSDTQVIPEPGTYAMIFSGFGMLIGFRKLRRRRSKQA